MLKAYRHRPSLNQKNSVYLSSTECGSGVVEVDEEEEQLTDEQRHGQADDAASRSVPQRREEQVDGEQHEQHQQRHDDERLRQVDPDHLADSIRPTRVIVYW